MTHVVYDGPDLSFVDVEDFLRALNTRNLQRSGSNWVFSCPGADHARGDSRPSARMDSRTTMWTCSSCGLRGNAISFLRIARELTGSEALRVIEERYGGPTTAPLVGDLETEVLRLMAAAQEPAPRVAPDESWVQRFAVDWTRAGDPWVDYMVGERGFSPEVLTDWEVGYDAISGRVAIPVRDDRGVLVGFKGRAIRPDQQPRYLIVGDSERRAPRYGFQTYSKSMHVFGLHRLVGHRALVLEGEVNVIALSRHLAGAVGVAGSEFSPEQARLIVEHAREAVVWFDADGAGRAGTQRVVEALSPYLPVSVVLDAPGDAAELSREESLSVIAGAVPHLQATIAEAIM